MGDKEQEKWKKLSIKRKIERREKRNEKSRK